MKKLWALILLLALAPLARAGTAISGTIKYPDGTGINGRLELKLIRSGTQDLCAGGQIVPTTAVTIRIVNGVITPGTTLVSSDCMSPTRVYQVRVYDDLNHTNPMTDNWYLQGPTLDVGILVSVFGLPSPISVPNPVVQGPTLNQTITVPNGTTTTILAGATGVVPLTVKAASGQVANMQTWISNAGAVLASINSAGAFTGTFSGNIAWSQLTGFPTGCVNQLISALLATPTCSSVNLATMVTGQLGTTSGGTGQNSSAVFPTSGNVLTEVNTFSLTNKTLDAEATGNVIRHPIEIQLMAGSCSTDAIASTGWSLRTTGSPSVVCSVGANGIQFATLRFANTGTPTTQRIMKTPAFLATPTSTYLADVRLVWNSATVSGTWTPAVDLVCTDPTVLHTSPDVAFTSWWAPGQQTADSTASAWNITTVTSLAWPASCTGPNQVMAIKLKRTDTVGTATNVDVTGLFITIRTQK